MKSFNDKVFYLRLSQDQAKFAGVLTADQAITSVERTR